MMDENTPNGRFLKIIASLHPVDLQNRLLAAPDKDLALSMEYMQDHDREMLLSKLSPSKAERVEEELLRNQHVAVKYDQYLICVESMIKRLSSGKPLGSSISFYRPRQKKHLN